MSAVSIPKVHLRPLQAADWPTVHTWASRLEACRYQPWGPNTEDETRAFTADAVAAWDVRPQTRYVYLALADDGSGQPIGQGEVHVRQAAHRHGEISYGIHPDLWGRGHGTALAQALLAVGFGELGFHRITGTCNPLNLGSARVLTKVGLRYEGRMREVMMTRDGWRDSSIYSILETEWAAR